YEKVRLEKGALPGEAVVFSHRDFLPCCGEVKMDGLIIRETPDSDKGALYLGSECVQKGAFIPADMIEKLRFEPMNAAVESASFRFSFEEGGASRTCLISFAEIPAAENAA
ncbi:MAG: hypothetical protein J6Z79_05535, partial [Clostridia bacterium]|nr:hypothetical protein [Clostridia bacterium]